MTRIPLEARFWWKVDQSGDGCWEWQAYRNASGYGVVGVEGNKTKLAHRVAWELTQGPIPDGLRVLHQCDNPACVRPDHLFIGTQGDNVADAVAKGRARGAVGERNSKAKLTEDDVRFIRRLHGIGIPRKAIAKVFGVNVSIVNAIGRRELWSHIPEGDSLVFDAEELRKVLEVPEPYEPLEETPNPYERTMPLPAGDRACPHCKRGRWKDSNGIERRCAYCGGVGRLAA